MAQTKKTLYLLFGGKSPEHEISIITAKQVFKHVDRDTFNLFPIYLDKQDSFFYVNNFEEFNLFPDFKKLHMAPVTITISNGKTTFSLGALRKLPSPDACFMAFHGGIGESGNIQGFLDMLEIPYTGPSQIGAVYGMDKIVMKMLFAYEHIEVLPWIYVNKETWESDQAREIGRIEAFCPYPLIVKPAALGSSIGVSKVTNKEQLTDAIGLNLLYGKQVVIEKFGEHMREFNCSVRMIEGQPTPSPIEEVFKGEEGVFSYDEKYVKGGKKAKVSQNEGMASVSRAIPAHIAKETEEHIKGIAKNVYNLVHGESLMRIDFLYDEKAEKIYVIEPNTIPGSISFYLWEAAGIQFHTLIESMVEEAIQRHKREEKVMTTFDSPLLH